MLLETHTPSAADVQDVEAPCPGRRRNFPFVAVAAVLVARTALLLSVAGRYGWHRDELYYLAAGRRPAAGYIDFPPVTPMLSALARVLFGPSLVGQRTLTIVAGGVVTVLVALIARELGGRTWAQATAALVVGVGPLLLGSNILFQTVSFDQVAWAATFLVVARMLRTQDPRWWPVLGAVAGVAMETKYTIGLLLAGVVVGFVSTANGRALLRGRGPWIALGIALVVVAPNLWWQLTHGWASVDFFRSQNAGTRADNPPLTFVRDIVLMGNPVAFPIVVAGAWFLFRRAQWRTLAIAAVVPVVGFLALGGKGYYAAPAVLALLPAGMVALERVVSTRRVAKVLVPLVLVAVTVPLLPIGIPIRSEHAMVADGVYKTRDDYAEELGWPELVDTVARVYRTLPAAERTRTGVLTNNYGEAGAIDLFGGSRGLPHAASAHLTYRYWGTPRPHATTLLVVGARAGWLDRHCVTWTHGAVIRNRDGVHNDEWGEPVDVCHLARPFAKEWSSIRADRP
jgi:hypothetical protein